MTILFVGGLTWVSLSLLLGLVAAGFGRSGVIFFLISLVLSPLLAGILLMAMGRADQSVKVRCGECGALAKKTARHCPGCGTQLAVTQASASQQTTEPKNKGHLSGIGILFVTAVIFLFALLGAALGMRFDIFQQGTGLLGGIVLGTMAAYGTKRIFPDHMTT